MAARGTLVFDFGIVDRAAEALYKGGDGDVALAAHEFGHALHYQESPSDFLSNSNDYEYLDAKADGVRDTVLEQLKKKRISIYGVEDPFAGTGFCAAEYDQC